MANLFNPLWKRTYDEGADISESIYGLSVEERPEFVSSAKVNGARRIVGIEQTTQRKISDIVVRCVSDGVSQHTLRKAIQDEMKDASAARQKNPRDGSRGPNHVILDGETVAIDAKFSNGLRFPRDPQDPRPEELINCRCYLTYGGF